MFRWFQSKSPFSHASINSFSLISAFFNILLICLSDNISSVSGILILLLPSGLINVTFFLNGGREKPFAGEDRLLVPSPQVATYDLQPEMSAYEVTDRIIDTLKQEQHPLIVANFANADMVGHSGIIKAAIKAIEVVDSCIGRIEEEILARNCYLLICADHGNAEKMLDRKGETLTAHSANPVPFILIGPEKYKLRDRGILADIAPTILDLAAIAVPPEMTGQSMIKGS